MFRSIKQVFIAFLSFSGSVETIFEWANMDY